ncbi:MAG: restriction endonuclease subunit S [Candidatus Thiodiazotropha sp.]
MSDVNQVHLEKLESLPEGWAETTVSKIVQMISTNKKKLAQKNYLDKGDFPVVDQGQEFIAGYSNNEALIIHGEPPFIVFGDHTRAFKFANFNFVPGADGVKVMKSLEVDPKWCFYIFQAIKLPNKGYARHFQYLKEAYLPVPPPEQQKRIVAKIEELFSHIDAGIEALKKAKQLLKQYRQSVLKAAVTGELTKEWREANKDDAQGSANVAGGRTPGAATKEETAQELLERILKERRQKWVEQQLEQFKAKGKMLKNDKWKDKYVAPESYDEKPPFELPTEWIWVYLGQLGEVIGGLTKNKKREQFELQLPYLRVANVYANELRLDDVTMIGVQESELERVLLEKGDLLVVEGNGSPEQIGRLAIWDGSIEPCVHQNHLIKVRLQEKNSGNYLMYWLSSLGGRDAILQVASSTSGLYTLSISKVSGLPIPLPPIKEQVKIHNIVSLKLSSIEYLENEINDQLLKAERNKQSILASAFSGNLNQG